MKRASRHFTDEDRRTIACAVAEAEARTSAEIVPVVATESGRYDRPEDLCGLTCSLGLFIIAWLLFQREDPTAGGWDGLPLTMQLPLLVIILLAGFLIGAIAATRIAWLRRFFTPRAMRRAEVMNRAQELFFDQRIHHTEAETGVLVFISLFERRAVVLADKAVLDALGPQTIETRCAELVRQLREGELVAGLCHTIERLGERLAETLPRELDADDDNELSDALILVD